jgi:hypothetical protein
VPAVLDAREGVADAGGGGAGRLDDDIQAVRSNQGGGVVGQAGGAGLQGGGERRRGNPLRRPVRAAAGFPRPGHVEVCNAEHVQPRREERLGQEHGAELPRADQADADRGPLLGPLKQHAVQVHRDLRGMSTRGEGPLRPRVGRSGQKRWMRQAL